MKHKEVSGKRTPSLFLFEVGYHLEQEEGRIPPQTGRREDPTSNRKRGRSHLNQEGPPLLLFRWDPPLFLFEVGSSSLPVCCGLLYSICLWWAPPLFLFVVGSSPLPVLVGSSSLPVCGGLTSPLFLFVVGASSLPVCGGLLPYSCLRWAPPLFLFVVRSSPLPVCGGRLLSSCL